MRYTPFGSVSTDCDSWLSRYSSTVQPASASSRESWALSKLASYQADPFSTAGMPGVPGPPGDRMLPTAIETLARVVWVGLPQAATPVFVTTVPSARLALRVARNLSTTTAPGASGPLTAP